MSWLKVSRMQFLVVSFLFLTACLSLAQKITLYREQDRLNEEVRNLTGVYEENRNMALQLEQFYVRVEKLQNAKEALEELLLWRAHTYLVVTEGLRHEAPGALLLSRSGQGSARYYPDLINMPVQSRSGLTGSDFEYVWRLYRAGNLKGTGEYLIRAEQDYGVSALVLAAIIVHESSWGRSAIARNKNNLAGLGAYDGSAYSSALSFDSKADSIDFLAALLSHHYLDPAGRHYNGPGLAGIGRAYATDPRWAAKVAKIMKQLVKAAIENSEDVLAYARQIRNSE